MHSRRGTTKARKIDKGIRLKSHKVHRLDGYDEMLTVYQSHRRTLKILRKGARDPFYKPLFDEISSPQFRSDLQSSILGQERWAPVGTLRHQRLDDLYSSSHPSHLGWSWCPILGQYIPNDQMVVHRLFPYDLDGDIANLLFDNREPDPPYTSSVDNLTYGNQIPMSAAADRMISKGYLAIVPDIEDLSNRDQRLSWYNSITCREYKIMVQRPDRPDIKGRIPLIEGINGAESQPSFRWYKLHNARVDFLSCFRPSPKLLYWRYLASRLGHNYILTSGSKPALSSKHIERFYQPFWTGECGWYKEAQIAGLGACLAPNDIILDKENGKGVWQRYLAAFLLSLQVEVGIEPPVKKGQKPLEHRLRRERGSSGGESEDCEMDLD